jgi:poly-beta-1,6-N-acetyl-D-glucosamine synthase
MIDYVVITPVKDEEKYIEFTIRSIVKQTILPRQWIIVDDGSVDDTKKIIKRYSSEYTWIKGVYTNSQGARQPGARHIKAFYEGYAKLEYNTWNYLVKLDGDVSFDEYYFEKCFDYFRRNPSLGIGGGTILNVIGDTLVPEEDRFFHVRGATKIYRRECWDAIGGIMTLPCYDTLDEVKANMMGYETHSFPDISILHHRYTGKAIGVWGNSVKNGLAAYVAGYHPIFMICKCIKRMFESPYLIGSIGLMHGFISGYLKNVVQNPDRELMDYLRQQQLRYLTFRESIWR